MQVMNPIPVVVASARPADPDNLRSLLAGAPWDVIYAPNHEKAAAILHRILLPIILCDENLDCEPWQETVRSLIKTRRRACISLLCDSSDSRKCEDLARQGGFDLLTRPFDRDQLFATLVCAYSQCRLGGFSFARILSPSLRHSGVPV